MSTIEEFEDLFGLNPDVPFNASSIEDISAQMNISLEKSISKVDQKYDAYTTDLVKILNENNNNELTQRINKLLESVYYARMINIGYARICELINEHESENTDISLFRFKAIDQEKNSKFQNFILFILNQMYMKKYVRYHDSVYKSITNDDGYDTKAYKKIGFIKDVIYGLVSKETNYDQFLNMLCRGNAVKDATDFLTNCVDSQFPQLKKDRHLFSFKNGIYNAYYDIFTPYANCGSSNTSAKYFDLNFNVYSDWTEIPTPVFDTIFKYQDISDEVMKWVYALTGRLLYEIDEKDGWQVILFIQGQAGTGKSTYTLDVCRQFYDDEDVGIMSNNIQAKFGLNDIVDNIIYVAPEIKRDFGIDQGEFQSIVSGDKVTINVKCKNSRFVDWKIPGVMAGNEAPDFIDNAGSIQRRIVPVKFNKKVKCGDLLLGKKLRNEIPNIMQKCNKAYLELSNLYGRECIWDVLPEYFKHTQQELAKSTNPLIHFLLSGIFEFDETKVVPEKLFIIRFNEHCSSNNYRKPRFNPDFYLGPFYQYNINVIHNKRISYRGDPEEPGTFFKGLDFID